jgi:hypothetical protein
MQKEKTPKDPQLSSKEIRKIMANSTPKVVGGEDAVRREQAAARK